jgi:serine/threonine protein kinase
VPRHEPIAIDPGAAPFDRYTGIHWLAPARSGHASHENVRHQLYVARGRENPISVLIKVASKPGLVYQQDLLNEISTLKTVNARLPDSPHFPWVHDHGELDDGRVYVVMSLFHEFPLAATVGSGPSPERLVSYLLVGIETARALAGLHEIGIVHVDLNPMNILHNRERGRPVIRVVDFESSYDRARHGEGLFYNPPTTPGYTAPEVTRQPPDGRADVYSLGAVLYTLLAANLWVRAEDLGPRIAHDPALDPDLRHTLLAAVDPDPAKRHASMAAFRTALAAYLEQIWPGGF